MIFQTRKNTIKLLPALDLHFICQYVHIMDNQPTHHYMELRKLMDLVDMNRWIVLRTLGSLDGFKWSGRTKLKCYFYKHFIFWTFYFYTPSYRPGRIFQVAMELKKYIKINLHGEGSRISMFCYDWRLGFHCFQLEKVQWGVGME